MGNACRILKKRCGICKKWIRNGEFGVRDVIMGVVDFVDDFVMGQGSDDDNVSPINIKRSNTKRVTVKSSGTQRTVKMTVCKSCCK